MKLTFLGARGAFTVSKNDFHSNAVLESPSGRRLLLDCGSDARHSLYKQGLTYSDITDVYVSHAHSDHAGGLEWLAFTRKFDPLCKLARLYASESLADELWRNTMSGGLKSIAEEKARIDTYFDLHAVRDEKAFTWEKLSFFMVPMVHVFNGNHRMPCHGVFFNTGNNKIFMTADTRFTPNELMPWYKKADIIVHDCETTPYASGIHARYDDLRKLSPEIRAKMWLIHYSDHKLPRARAHGFAGFIKRGQVFDLGKTIRYQPN